MLAEFVNKITELATPVTYKVDGKTYSRFELDEVRPCYDYPESLSVNSLDSICALVRNEVDRLAKKFSGPVYIHADAYNRVSVCTSWDDRFHRSFLYQATPDVPGFNPGWRSRSTAIIELRSMFQDTEDVQYLLQLLSRITDENSVTSNDNGITQKVEARSGIALNEVVSVKPRVTLKPYRTFRELDQPESEFLLRVDADKGIGLFEADGGTWHLKAKDEAAAYFEAELSDLIKAGKVVVMR